jgi:hypothetical protein
LPHDFIKENPNGLSKFIHFVIQAEKMRVGNCTELAVVAASYLWRFSGKEINRIEVVKSIDFDHVWLILRAIARNLANKAQELFLNILYPIQQLFF